MKATLPLLLLLSLAANGLTQSFATDYNPRLHGDEAMKSGLKADVLARLDAALQRAVENHEVSGVIGLIHRNGQRGYFESFGWQDIEAREPMPKDANFRLKIMSKPVVTVAALVLFDDGTVLPRRSNLEPFTGVEGTESQRGGQTFPGAESDRAAHADDPQQRTVLPASRQACIPGHAAARREHHAGGTFVGVGQPTVALV